MTSRTHQKSYLSTNNRPSEPADGHLLGKSSFRPIHYLGSKLRILDFIQTAVDVADPSNGTVCDLFSGSGCVAHKLSLNRSVVAVDIQEYSRVICSALLHPPPSPERFKKHYQACIKSQLKKTLEWAIEPLDEYESRCMELARDGDCEPLFELIENGSIVSFQNGNKKCSVDLSKALGNSLSRLKNRSLLSAPSSISIRYFGGLYFSYKQAAHLDYLLETGSSLPQVYKNSFLSAILSTASDAVNTIGKQFAQPIRPKRNDGTLKLNLLNKIIEDRGRDINSLFEEWLLKYISISDHGKSNRVLRMDYLQALKNLGKDVKVVYADPPYTRDHYSRFYHVLETLALRDNPTISKSCLNGGLEISRGIYREDRHQSPFCIKTQVPKAFDNLFSIVRDRSIPLLLSYSPYSKIKKSHPRMMTMEQLEKLAKKYYPVVDILSPGKLSHSKLNRSDKNFNISYEAELLLMCRISK